MLRIEHMQDKHTTTLNYILITLGDIFAINFPPLASTVAGIAGPRHKAH